jgi:hypothetical protein
MVQRPDHLGQDVNEPFVGGPMSGSPLRLRWLRASTVRAVLGALLALGAMNAFLGGGYAMAGARGIPTAWLEPGPFVDYFVPGLILFVVVGGTCAIAALAVFTGHRWGRTLALASAALVFAFLMVELHVVGSFSWIQPASAIGASLIIALARRRGPPS